MVKIKSLGLTCTGQIFLLIVAALLTAATISAQDKPRKQKPVPLQKPEAAESEFLLDPLTPQTSDDRRNAMKLQQSAQAFYATGNVSKALETWQRALMAWQRTGDEKNESQTWLLLGGCYQDLGNPDKAVEAFNRALTLWERLNDVRGKARTVTALGKILFRQGKLQEASDSFSQSLTLLNQTHDTFGKAQVLNAFGAINEQLAQWDEALSYYQQSLQLWRKLQIPQAVAEQSIRMGLVQYHLKNYAQALALQNEALRINQKLRHRHIDAYALLHLGMIAQAQDNAPLALMHYERALVINRANQNYREEAEVLTHLGELALEQNRYQTAIAHLTAALPLHRRMENRPGELDALYYLAGAEKSQGRFKEAREYLEQSLLLAETLRSRLVSRKLRQTYFAGVRKHYELYIAVLMQQREQIRVEAQVLELTAQALHLSEQTRARSLLEYLLDAHEMQTTDAAAPLLKRERQLRQTIAARTNLRLRLLMDEVADPDETAALTHSLLELNREYDNVLAQIIRQGSRFSPIFQPQSLRLTEIQQQLSDDTVLLEFALGEEASWLWAVSSTGISSYRLPPRAEIETAARQFRQLLTARQSIPRDSMPQFQQRVNDAAAQLRPAGARLSRMLLGQAIGDLKKNRLLIVTEGVLNYIPFAALPDPAMTAPPAENPVSQMLLSNHEITYLPSASVLALIREDVRRRQPAARQMAILADPVYEADDPRLLKKAAAPGIPATPATRAGTKSSALMSFSRLPWSRREAQNIASLIPAEKRTLLLDFEASRMSLPLLQEYRILHFATHGVYDTKHAERSGLMLSLFDSQGKKVTGLLGASEIFQFRWPADLVVLSGCDTGLGQEIQGEGIIGLTRGLMVAGAARVITSLWQVDDSATAELMQQFYQHLFIHKKSPAAALRAAQLELSQHSRWHSPFYWAGFVLHGEWEEMPTW